MKSSITVERYLDKVRGCFLGKALAGTMGAPYEGVKMPMELPFKREMIDAMLPNDDLDLQVLWLDAAEERGADFTSYDLLKRFVQCCDYSPGEYAVMRKNFDKGIYPPVSGRFCNDFYREGMGCPIRSEIWACLAAGEPEKAADFASRDGCLDHEGESIYAERFFAALEAMAFEENIQDTDTLKKGMLHALAYIPDCQFSALVRETIAWTERYGDIKAVLSKILFQYGHPDCTNMYQNMGITLASLLLGELDLIQTSMMALNCGFDTDCTCASAGALIGIIRGADYFRREYGIDDLKYVLGVQSNRRSDSIYDLAEDIAALGAHFTDEAAASKEVAIAIRYENDCPSISIGGTNTVLLTISNPSDAAFTAPFSLTIPEPLTLRQTVPESIVIPAGGAVTLPLAFHIPRETRLIPEKNLLALSFGDVIPDYRFGLSGAAPWKVIGPIWRTEPVSNTELLMKVPSYWHLLGNSKIEGSDVDRVRHFHLNFAVDTETDYVTEQELFAPYDEIAPHSYETRIHHIAEDSFRTDEFFGFKGPCAVYMARELVAEEEMTVCIQLGHSAPYSLWINGELASRRDYCDTWTSENVHLKDIPLHKGVNRIVFRLTRVNEDAKFNLIFSKGETCAEHLTCFSSVNPEYFS